MSANNLTYKNLRLVRAPLLKTYIKNTQLWRQIGNEAFAKHVIAEKNNNIADTAYYLYHSWLPEFKLITQSQAEKIEQLINDEKKLNLPHRSQPPIDKLANIGWLNDRPADINALSNRALSEIIAIQNRYEITEYLKLVQKKQPKVIIEIGTARGGMLYSFSQLATTDALIISIDLPGAPNCGGQTVEERQFYSSFTSQDQTLEFIPADSHLPKTKELLKLILQGKKADVLFIDGDHSYKGVKQDYEMYKEFSAEDGLITFHDIKMYPKVWGVGNEVGLFWDEITATSIAFTEIVDPDGLCQPHRPEGVEACWGIGILGKHSTN